MSDSGDPIALDHETGEPEPVPTDDRFGLLTGDFVIAPKRAASAPSAKPLIVALVVVAVAVFGYAASTVLRSGSDAPATRPAAGTDAKTGELPAGTDLARIMLPASIPGFSLAPNGVGANGVLTPEQYVDGGGLQGPQRQAAIALLRRSDIYSRTWRDAAGERALVEIAFRFPTNADANDFVGGAASKIPGSRRFAVPGVPGAVGGTVSASGPGVEAGIVVFRKGPLGFSFTLVAEPGKVEHAPLVAVAQQQFARAPAISMPGARTTVGNTTDRAGSSYAIGKLAGVVLVVILIAALLATLVRRRKRGPATPTAISTGTAACANGHPVAEHQRFCTACGSEVAAA